MSGSQVFGAIDPSSVGHANWIIANDWRPA